MTPLVNAILADPLTFLEQNALLTFDLQAGGGVPLVPCFTAGTGIVTRSGERAVETLAVGDEVLTLDHGFQPIRWIGRKALGALDLAERPDLRPIRIAAGALGEGLPERDLIVSPQHRCLVRSDIARRMTGEREVLAAAKHLLGQPGIDPLPAGAEVVYVHILFDRHELVFSNGAVTESFYPGPQGTAALDDAALREIHALFPGLSDGDPNGGPAPARAFLGGHAARSLVKRSVRNTRQLVQRRRPLRA
ncbi:MAG: Hint domain-containing protein [Rhodobacterales bacterium]|nr:Hint domain-containing protein [Rhodobacterales bacterium]